MDDVCRRASGKLRRSLGTGADGRNGGEQVLGLSAIPECPAHVSVSIHVTGTKNETAAELERILAEPVLPVSARLGALSCLGVIAAQQVQEVGFPQARRAIRRALAVYQKRERDAGFLAEQAGVAGVAQAYRGQVRSFVFERLLMFAQLRDVLAAENSPVVPQKNQHGGLTLPKRAEPDLAPIGIRQHDAGQRLAEGAGHRSTIDPVYRHPIDRLLRKFPNGSHRPGSGGGVSQLHPCAPRSPIGPDDGTP
jgi:hypothetical protein